MSQHGMLAASVASHCVWGALICWPFGFSYDLLHFSVGIAAWLGAICVYFASAELGGSKRSAFLAALAMVVGPFYYGMSFTFMTDVTASAFACVAVLGYVKGIRKDSLAWLLLGAFGGSMAAWARQTHICVIMIPLVALCGQAWHSGRFVRSLKCLCVAVGVPTLSLIAFEMGFLVPSNENRLGIVDVDQHDWTWVRQTIMFAYGGGLLLGLVALPLSPMVFSSLRRDGLDQNNSVRTRWGIASAVLVLLFWGGVFVASTGRTHLTQSTGYILYNAHLGPILLGDQNDPGRWSDIGNVRWPPFVWQILTLGAIATLTLIAMRLGSECRSLWPAILSSNPTNTNAKIDLNVGEQRSFDLCKLGLLVCLASAVSGLLLYVEMVYDRYWILCYPMLFTWLGSEMEHDTANNEVAKQTEHTKPPRASLPAYLTGAICIVFFAGSFVFVHDFLAWNHTRYAQVNEWLERGLEPKDFDAGNGINGWYRAQEDVETYPREGDSSHFWRGLATHALAIGKREGWTVKKKLTWNSWAAAKNVELLVLKKE